MTIAISKQQWLASVTSDRSRKFFETLIQLLEERNMDLVLNDSGYFGIRIPMTWNGKERRVFLSDTYQAHRTFNFEADTLRLGYDQEAPDEIKLALDPWVDLLHTRFNGRSRRNLARYEEWQIPSSDFSALNIASEVEIAARRIAAMTNAA